MNLIFILCQQKSLIMKLFRALKNVNLKPTNCPECGEVQPKVRKPKNFREALWGGNTCNNCGCEMDRFGKKL